jgi:chaperone BCS1
MFNTLDPIFGPVLGSIAGHGILGSLLSSAKDVQYDKVIPKAVQAAIIAGIAYEVRQLWRWLYDWVHAWILRGAHHPTYAFPRHRADKTELFPIAYIASGDPAYRWILAWLASDPDAQAQLKHFVLSTSRTEDDSSRRGSRNVIRSPPSSSSVSRGPLPPRPIKAHNASFQSDKVIGQILPCFREHLLLFSMMTQLML